MTTVKEFIKYLQRYDPDMQVAIYNPEFFQHETKFQIRIERKENETNEPHSIDEDLEQEFISIQ